MHIYAYNCTHLILFTHQYFQTDNGRKYYIVGLNGADAYIILHSVPTAVITQSKTANYYLTVIIVLFVKSQLRCCMVFEVNRWVKKLLEK